MDNLRGSIFMVAAMAMFAVEDMFVKSATATLPVGLVLILFGLGGTLGFAVLAKRRGDRLMSRDLIHRSIALKAVTEISGRLFFITSLAMAPLSTVSALLQATPLVVVAGAAVFFGEKVGWRRWLAIAVGFVGVLIVLRPGMDGFTLGAGLAVLGMLGFAGRDLTTRAAPKTISNMVLGFYGFMALIPTGAVLLAFTGGARVPTGPEAGAILGAICVGVAAYYALTVAMRAGDISVVAPFRYTRMVFALILGVAVFGERPDAATLVGSAIIVASGVYTLLRSRRVALD